MNDASVVHAHIEVGERDLRVREFYCGATRLAVTTDDSFHHAGVDLDEVVIVNFVRRWAGLGVRIPVTGSIAP